MSGSHAMEFFGNLTLQTGVRLLRAARGNCLPRVPFALYLPYNTHTTLAMPRVKRFDRGIFPRF